MRVGTLPVALTSPPEGLEDIPRLLSSSDACLLEQIKLDFLMIHSEKVRVECTRWADKWCLKELEDGRAGEEEMGTREVDENVESENSKTPCNRSVTATVPPPPRRPRRHVSKARRPLLPTLAM
jgi:hypothetical protein